MFDTMTITKAGGALCGALLIFLLGKWGAELLYHTGGGHYGEDHASGYAIQVDDGAAADAEPEEELDLATVLANGDAGKGERVYNKCRACHKLEDGANATGPHLYGVVNREIGAVDGFGYSGALSEQGADVWTPETLYAFFEDPRGWAPGTSMSFAGLNKSEDRADLIAYLSTIGN
jgi:cytochrome c